MSDPRISTAPPGTGTLVLGKTLPDLLYETAAKLDNPSFMNQPTGAGWQAFSVTQFRDASEEIALGLLAHNLERGDRVALFMESDTYFGLADMGCLIAGMVSVPIYITHTDDAVRYVIEHAEARALFVSDSEGLRRLLPLLEGTAVKTVVIAQPEGTLEAAHAGVEIVALEALQKAGCARREADAEAIPQLLAQIDPHDLATIIYTSGTTGRPKGVMLTHENISSNGIASISGLGDFGNGQEEIALSFLPMTHIFQRTMHYCYVAYGTSTYFCTPEEVGARLREVRPTTFATVPRVLEKVYAGLLEKAETLTGARGALMRWALGLARRYELGKTPTGVYALQLKLADRLVFSKWREALGGRISYIIVGGAALSGEIANIMAAAGIPCLQGYGLTETSPVISFNRPGRNRAGTVGEPLAGVEVTIAEDGEILTRGPHVMQGYYKDEERTREVMDDAGWFHTGDVGEFTPEGRLQITDRKKDLFKLSTGKYVMPQPLESQLTAEPLIEQAVVVGAGYKFTTALLFPDQAALRAFAERAGVDAAQSFESLLNEPQVVARYQELIDRANEGMDPWSTIKRFRLVPDHLTIENGLLTPTLKLKRAAVRQRFEQEIAAMYTEARQPAVA